MIVELAVLQRHTTLIARISLYHQGLTQNIKLGGGGRQGKVDCKERGAGIWIVMNERGSLSISVLCSNY